MAHFTLTQKLAYIIDNIMAGYTYRLIHRQYPIPAGFCGASPNRHSCSASGSGLVSGEN